MKCLRRPPPFFEKDLGKCDFPPPSYRAGSSYMRVGLTFFSPLLFDEHVFSERSPFFLVRPATTHDLICLRIPVLLVFNYYLIEASILLLLTSFFF